jgi:tungstate transport system substrate-binding protein
VSRGDDSGNQARELELWSLASVELDAAWYQSLGAGMLETLTRASVLGAYALADRPTYLVHQSALDLKVLVRGDSRLHNAYGVIAVNPTRVKGTHYAGAAAFIDFLTSSSARAIITEFGRAEFGESLFSPLGGAKDND